MLFLIKIIYLFERILLFFKFSLSTVVFSIIALLARSRAKHDPRNTIGGLCVFSFNSFYGYISNKQRNGYPTVNGSISLRSLLSGYVHFSHFAIRIKSRNHYQCTSMCIYEFRIFGFVDVAKNRRRFCEETCSVREVPHGTVIWITFFEKKSDYSTRDNHVDQDLGAQSEIR